MSKKYTGSTLKYTGSTLSLAISVLIFGVVVRWLGITPGNLVDWIVGVSSFGWLLIIVTIPWNIYFDARETLNEAKVSQEKGLEVDLKQVEYVASVAKWSLVIAIALHLITALVLYLFSAFGISDIGYVSSGLALLLTVARPIIRGYLYLYDRLTTIKKEVKYPREDVLSLKDTVEKLNKKVAAIEQQLDTKNENSLISKQQQQQAENRTQIATVSAQLENYQAQNAVQHDQLAREATKAISQLNEDSQFLGHVREIIRFVKTS